MSTLTAVLCVGAALCDSLQGALWLTGVAALTALAAQPLGLSKTPRSPALGGLLGVGVGGGLWLLTQGFFPAVAAAVPHLLLLCVLFFLCGAAASNVREISVFFLCRVTAAWWVTGALREWLSRGSLFGWQFPFEGVSGAFGFDVGGFLVAAGVLWLFRLGTVPTLPLSQDKHFHLTVAAITAALGLLQNFLPELSLLWRFWIYTAVTAAVLTVRFGQSARNEWRVAAVLPSAAVCLLPIVPLPQGVLWAAGAAVATGGIAAAATAIQGRLRRVPASFGGAPATLTVVAVAAAALSPL